MDKRSAGRRGGLSASRGKRLAARRNGKLGGRPSAAEALMKKVQRISAELLPQLPHIDPGELSQIVESLLRPAEERVVFVRPLGNGLGHVF